MAEPVGYYTMFGPGESANSANAPELVEDPSFSGGWAFESFDPSTGDPERYAVDWGSLKTIDFGTPPADPSGSIRLGHGGEIFESIGSSTVPAWSTVGSLYGSSIWADPDATGGALVASLPTYDPKRYAVPTPVYHSTITGTFDPTPAAIIAAAITSGTPVPSGVDPVEFSRMMSGLPATPLTASLSSSTSSSPLGLLTSSPMPASPTSGSSLPASMPIGGAFSGVSGSPFTTAMKTLSFDGGGGILCDPITGKCPQYR